MMFVRVDVTRSCSVALALALPPATLKERNAPLVPSSIARICDATPPARPANGDMFSPTVFPAPPRVLFSVMKGELFPPVVLVIVKEVAAEDMITGPLTVIPLSKVEEPLLMVR